MTHSDEDKRLPGAEGEDSRQGFEYKAPKPPRPSGPRDDGRWISPPPVDWTTRPVGEGAGGQEEEPPKPRKQSFFSFGRILRDIVIPLAIAFGIALTAQATIAKPYQIPTGSMEPTIQVNDRILANRFIYHIRSIEQGDIIVFKPPEKAEGTDSDTPYVKRVIGLPGDTVRIEGGKTYVNGEEYVVESVTEPPRYARKEEVVPDGMLFVLGDNRNSSRDSHIWGYLPIENVIGRADIIYWPPGNIDWL